MERHRALWRLLASGSPHPETIVDVGPLSARVYGSFIGTLFPGVRLVTADRWPRGNPFDPRDVGFADVYCDLRSLHEHVAADMLLMQHVVEEIDDYRAALAALRRALCPGGSAWLEIPTDDTLCEHVAQTPDRYGNVWRFATTPMLRELESLFGSVTAIPYAEGGQKGAFFHCRT